MPQYDPDYGTRPTNTRADIQLRAETRSAFALPEDITILPGGAKRASDALRQRYLAHLGECYALGYFTKDEYDRRVSYAGNAVAEQELRLLLEDLPALTEPAQPRPKQAIQALKWKNVTAVQRLATFIVTAILGIATGFGLPIYANTADWPAPVQVLAFIGGIFGGIIIIALSVFLAVTDKKIQKAFG